MPTPFVGTETVLDPIKFKFDTHIPAPGGPNAGEGSIVQGGSEPEGTAGSIPPFNTVSNYRDPEQHRYQHDCRSGGRGSVECDSSHSNQRTSTIGGPAFQDVAVSRQGYGSQTTLYQFDSSGKYPSIFSNRFRAPGGADMVPLTGLAHKPVNAVFAQEGADPDANTSGVPLLAKNYPTGGSHAHNRSAGNPYFYFETMGRFTNKIATRSNVYAVWVTVGYFEVTPWLGTNPGPNSSVVIDVGHPDGYQLGQELGADTGEIERHRGFYMIDRSIPVGFQRGVDNNVNNAVILKRFIE